MRWWLLVLGLLAPVTVLAHPLAPVAVDVVQAGEVVTVTVKRSVSMPRRAQFSPRFPASCRVEARERLPRDGSSVEERYRLQCPSSLIGETFGLDGLDDAGVDALVLVSLDDGRELRALLDRDEKTFAIPPPQPWWAELRTLTEAGTRHLLGGWDHMLFVVGLVFLLGRARRVLWALTAFTLGHGLAMAATVFDVVTVSPQLAELGIAGTLLWLARALLREDPQVRPLASSYLAPLGVGSLHGLGFATAFTELGVAPDVLGRSLFAFHLGIEAGQVVVVLLALALVAGVRRHGDTARVATAWMIGSFAVMALVLQLS